MMTPFSCSLREQYFAASGWPVGGIRTMQAPPRLAGDAFTNDERATILAAGQCRFLTLGERGCAWQCAKQAASARQQRTFLIVSLRAREERALLRRFAALPAYGAAGSIQTAAIELGVLFRLHTI
jgi:hypothetical protein